MSTSSTYIKDGNTTGNVVGPWIRLVPGGGNVAFQVNMTATGTPIGAFIFETTDDDNPNFAAPILGAATVPLVGTYAGATFQPTDGTARAVNFDFGPGQPVPSPTAGWIRMRYARTSGGTAVAGNFNVGVSQRGGI